MGGTVAWGGLRGDASIGGSGLQGLKDCETTAQIEAWQVLRLRLSLWGCESLRSG